LRIQATNVTVTSGRSISPPVLFSALLSRTVRNIAAKTDPTARAEGTVVGEVCRKAGISEATFYNWRRKYNGLTPSGMKRLRQFEENGKLQKIVADLSLDNDAAGRDPPKTLKPARKRQLVDHARSTWRVSIRRACRALPVDR
jgi:hypothetical protein